MATCAFQPRSHAARSVSIQLAKAFHAAALYGLEHKVTRARLVELAAASSGGAPPITWHVEPGRVVLDGEALEPGALFAPVAHLLQSLGLASLELRAPLSTPVAAALLNVLVRAEANSSEPGVLARLVGQSTGDAVRVRGYSAGALHFQAAGGPARTGEASPSFHQMNLAGPVVRTGAGEDGMPNKGPIHDVLTLFRQHRSTAPAGAGRPADCPVREAIAGLEEPDRRTLLDLLGAGGSMPFDDAAGLLSLMPADQVAEAIRVLERRDAKPSVTGLMVLRRLSRVSLGNPAEFNRLASVANGWAGRGADQEGHAQGPQHSRQESQALAGMTATLLTRMSQTEFRPEEYTRLLEELINTPEQLAMGISVAMADDVSQARLRAFEVTCEAMESAGSVPPPDSHPLRLLLRTGGAVADLGRADLMMRALKIAAKTPSSGKPDGGDNDALALTQTAEVERWLPRALAMCGDAAMVREAIGALGAPTKGAEVLVTALTMTSAAWRRRAIMECAWELGAAVLAGPARRAVLVDPEVAPRLTDLVRDVCTDRAIEIFEPALHHTDQACRRRAFEALAEVGVAWPRDVCRRGLSDPCEAVRMATIGAIGLTPGPSTRLVVDRLAGDFAAARVTPAEAARLTRAIEANQTRAITNYLAWKVVVRALFRRPGVDLGALAIPLRARGRTVLSLVAMWVCPAWAPAQARATGEARQ